MQSRPAAIDKDMVDLYDIGKRLMREDHAKYLGEQVAEWEIELEPREDHFDALTTITTPLQRAGVYLLSAHMDEGNTSRVIVWVEDTVIVEKELGNRLVYFVADAATGRPIEGARVEIFGLAQRRVGNTPEVRVESPHLVATTDANGLCYPDPDVFKASNYGCLIVASKDQGSGEGRRMAFLRNSLGYNPSWFRSSYDAGYRWFSERIKAIAITDRPVYRPGHEVTFKLWIDNARYDRDRRSPAAGRPVEVWILDARREECFQREFVADEFGGVAGSFEIPAAAPLGEYSISTSLDGNGIETSGTFRVEEYKKPEFEVTIDAPREPVRLGEKFTARVDARYYFGAPVAEGTVRYRVTRTSDDSPLFPPRHWDWFYGPGYAWFPMTCGWYPGWDDWGFTPAQPSWWGTSGNPPELVAEDEVPIRPDGTIEIEIDTAAAAARHGERIHRYRIAAEVVDQSRRTIVTQSYDDLGRNFRTEAYRVNQSTGALGDKLRSDT